MANDDTITVRVLRGTHRRADRTRAVAGETVELTREQLEKFPDGKFERLVDAVESPASDEAGEDASSAESDSPAGETAPEGKTDTAVATGDESESDSGGIDPADLDWATLRSMAVLYDGDEITGGSPKDDIIAFFRELPDADVELLHDAV